MDYQKLSIQLQVLHKRGTILKLILCNHIFGRRY